MAAIDDDGNALTVRLVDDGGDGVEAGQDRLVAGGLQLLHRLGEPVADRLLAFHHGHGPHAIHVGGVALAAAVAGQVAAEHRPVGQVLHGAALAERGDVLLQFADGLEVVADLQLAGALVQVAPGAGLVDLVADLVEGVGGLEEGERHNLFAAFTIEQPLEADGGDGVFAAVEVVGGQQVGRLAAGLGVQKALHQVAEQARVAGLLVLLQDGGGGAAGEVLVILLALLRQRAKQAVGLGLHGRPNEGFLAVRPLARDLGEDVGVLFDEELQDLGRLDPVLELDVVGGGDEAVLLLGVFRQRNAVVEVLRRAGGGGATSMMSSLTLHPNRREGEGRVQQGRGRQSGDSRQSADGSASTPRHWRVSPRSGVPVGAPGRRVDTVDCRTASCRVARRIPRS